MIRGRTCLRESLASLERCILMRRTFLSYRPDRGFNFDFDVNLLEKRQLLASYSYNSGTGLLTVQTTSSDEQLSIISTSESGNYTITTTGSWTGSATGITDSLSDLYVNQPSGLASILIDDNNGTISGSGLSFGTSSANFVNHLTANFTSPTSGTITVGGSGASFINGANLSLTTTGNSISVTQLISANGSGAVSLTGRNIVVTGNITTTAGDITLRGNNGSYQAGSFDGVRASGSVISSSSGNILIDGRAAGGSLKYGVNLQSSSVNAGGAGCVTITGVSGNGSGMTYGMKLEAGACISTNNGSVNIDGNACGTGSDSTAVFLSPSSKITSTGLGDVFISGTVSNGTNHQFGIYSQANITTSTGSINFNGISCGTGNYSYGVALLGSLGTGYISANGAGNVTITGTAANGTDQARGVMTSGASITTNSGSITFNGISCGTGTLSTGVSLAASNISAIGVGNVTITGTAQNGTTFACGVFVSGSSITTNSGLLNLNGTSCGTGSDSFGVDLNSSTIVSSTGAGDVFITGTSKNCGNWSTGIAITATVTTNTGNLTINGIANGTGRGRIGVQVFPTSSIAASGSGNVTIIGIGANSTDNSGGVAIGNGSITTITGAITINGTSYFTGNDSVGVSLFESNISATGNGNVTITGRSDGNLSSGLGILSYNSGSKIYSNAGLITFTANSMNLTGTVDATSAGNVLIQTLGAGVNLGGSDDSSSLGLTSTELGQITANLLTIGNSTTGNVVISSDLSWPTNFTLNTGTLLSGTLSANTLTQGSSSLTSTGRLTVNPLSYSILVTAGSPVTYGTNLLLTATLTHSGTSFNTGTISFYNEGSLLGTGNISGDVATYNWTGAGAATYTNITATGNVTFAASSGSNTATATVNPYSLTVTANRQTKAYSADVPNLTFTNTPLVYGDTASVFTGNLTTTGTANSGVGNYSISQGNFSAGSNYSISFTSSNLSVTPYSLTVTANAQTKDYSVSVPNLTYTATLVNGDTSSVFSGNLTTSGTANSGVGNYSISQGNLSGGSNYSISFIPSNLSVIPYSLTVTANAQTKVYGPLFPNLTFTNATLVNGDTDIVFTGN